MAKTNGAQFQGAQKIELKNLYVIPQHLDNLAPLNNVPPHLRGVEPTTQNSMLPHLQSATPATVEKKQRGQDSPPHLQTSSPLSADTSKNGDHSGGGVRVWDDRAQAHTQDQMNSQSPTPAQRGQSTQPSAGIAAVNPTTSQSIPSRQAQDSSEEWLRMMGILPKAGPAPAKTQVKIEKASEAAEIPKAPEIRETPKTSEVPMTNEEKFLAEMFKPKALLVTRTTNTDPPHRPSPLFNRFRPDAIYKLNGEGESKDNFQSFLRDKKNTPLTNGKTYTFNEPAALPVVNAEKHENTSAWVDTITQNIEPASRSSNSKKENISPFQNVDPHAVFGPPKVAPSATNNTKPVDQESDQSKQVARYKAGRWTSGSPFTDSKLAGEIMLAELDATPTKDPLTQDALVKTTGFAPRDCISRFDVDDMVISDAGVPQVKEGVRAHQGVDAAQQFLDFDGKTWLPPPCDWDYERPGGRFNDSFIPEYIREWCATITEGTSVTVDTDIQLFRFGKRPINNADFDEEIVQPDSIPGMISASLHKRFHILTFLDLENDNEERRLHQTATIESHNFSVRFGKQQKKMQRTAAASAARHAEIASKEDEANPFSPTIDIYLRPAMDKDANSVAMIYNHYVSKSNVTEDQATILDSDASFLITNARTEKLPFIVAVKGHEPPQTDAQGRPGAGNKALVPQFETIVGFAFAEVYNYGFNGSRKGRSRTNATLQLFVHHEYTKNGIGRNLLDRLIHTMCSAYALKNGAPWINPDNDNVHESGGSGLWHQLFFQVPVEKKFDPTFPHVKAFLEKIFFEQVALFLSAARTSVHRGAATWVDLAIFQCEASHGMEFDAYI
jgi:hypothetical protein